MFNPRLLLSLSSFLLPLCGAQDPYRLPPQEIVDLVDAAPTPSLSFSPDAARFLVLQSAALPPIAEISRPMLRLAGMRIDPVANARFGTRFLQSVALQSVGADEAQAVPLPAGQRISNTSWSPDSSRFVIVTESEHGSSLWLVNASDPEHPLLLTDRLCTVTAGPRWRADSRAILCHLVPEERGEAPAPPSAPNGPRTEETGGGKRSPVRTYQDLLQNEYDIILWQHYARTQLVLIDLEHPDPRPVDEGIFAGASISPDGNFLLTEKITWPYSYQVPWSRFARKIEVRDVCCADRWTVAELPPAEEIPIGGVRTGPRNVHWASNAPATVVWAEALDGGDPKREAEHRDRWLSANAARALAAPKEVEPIEIARLEQRATGLQYLPKEGLFIASEYDRDRRWRRSTLVDLPKDGKTRVIEDRSIHDHYGDPGNLVTTIGPLGTRVVRLDHHNVYRSGRGASPEGDLPFLDRIDMASGESQRLWRCLPGTYASVSHVLAADSEDTLRVIVRRESPNQAPNYFLKTLPIPQEGGDVAPASEMQLTAFSDPQPSVRGITKKRLVYEREDGVPLSGTLYLPADYREGTRLPLLVWGYPREYNDTSTAGQVSGSTSRFTTLRGSSHLMLLTQGYAILDGATMPIVGDAESMNDTFREQLVASAAAAIDAAVGEGVADRERCAVAGHSYGAFMTANLLAHSNLFRAGVARSGAYNRTLTPFGFQSERRTLWEAPETYFAVSPFMHADKINEPILLVHGEVDNNSGTFPMQSKRLYQALKGHGGTARLVMLPAESHGYRARESVLHMQAETHAWLERHVRNAPERPVEETQQATEPVGSSGGR